jgi:Holliday junction resolvase RusA-like endonuclease
MHEELHYADPLPLEGLDRLNEQSPPVSSLPRLYRFFVPGMPITQGHKTAGVNPHTGKAFMRETGGSRLKLWRHAINDEARKVAEGFPIDGPVAIELFFWLPKPKTAPKRKRTYPIKRGLDVDTAARAALDAITGVLITDDARVIRLLVEKDYGELDNVQGLAVTVREYRR